MAAVTRAPLSNTRDADDRAAHRAPSTIAAFQPATRLAERRKRRILDRVGVLERLRLARVRQRIEQGAGAARCDKQFRRLHDGALSIYDISRTIKSDDPIGA